MAVLTYTDTLTITECGDCHIPFAIPQNLYRSVRRTGAYFYCPNGHCIHYYETENQELKRQLANRDEDLRIVRADRDQERRRASAYKGQVTKARRRQAAGTCPCCKRTFPNMARHMQDEHPEFVDDQRRK